MELPITISREAGKGHLITAWLRSALTCITGTGGVCSSLRRILIRRLEPGKGTPREKVKL